MEQNDITRICIGCAYEVHTILGPGLLESAYKECLYYKIKKSGLTIQKEFPIPLSFENVYLECGYRVDLLVEGSVVLEIKSVDRFNPIYLAQLLTYLKIGNFHLGLLMNFNVLHMREGIKRVIY